MGEPYPHYTTFYVNHKKENRAIALESFIVLYPNQSDGCLTSPFPVDDVDELHLSRVPEERV